MFKKSQSSIWDSLIRIMPELENQVRSRPEYIDPIAANCLYSMWRTGVSKDGSSFRRPPTLGKSEVDRMKNCGLIKVIGNEVKVTEKGSKVIKVMILGDDRSVFEDNGVDIDYNKALSNTRTTKTAKSNKAAQKEEGWWDRFER